MSAPYLANHFTSREEYQKHQHFHDVNQILFSLNEGCDYFMDSKTYSIQPGVLVLIPAGTIHTMIHRDQTLVDSYSIHYPASLLKKYASPQTNLSAVFENLKVCVQIPRDRMQRVLGLFRDCLAADDGSFGADLRCTLAFFTLLLELYPYVGGGASCSEKVAASQNPLVSEILHYIDAHLTEPLSLDLLAARFFISKYTLCHIFKNNTGFTVVDYINSNRIRLSCALLREGAAVKDAAARVGFSNNAHFIRTFQQHTKITPGRYAQRFKREAVRYNFIANQIDGEKKPAQESQSAVKSAEAEGRL